MLSSARIGTSSWRYYTGAVACRATEYYVGVGEAPGRWTGQGLSALGLAEGGRVSEQQLEALFSRGLHPSTGEKLGRAWRSDGVTGFDLTFSAPKSVSALWALGSSPTDGPAPVAVPDAVADAALAAHQAAVQTGLAYLQTHAALSRRGTDGVEQITTAGLTAALFDHRTSRAGDPQLHTHALVLNKALCTDGVWRTLDSKELYGHLKTAGMIYQTALRNEMQRRLGVDFEPVSIDGQAEIAGVPKGLLKKWSKRTTAITAEAGPKIAEYEKALDRGLSARERFGVTKTAVLKTRPGKAHTEIGTLRATWAAEAAALGWTPDRLAQAAGVTTQAAGRAVVDAVDGLGDGVGAGGDGVASTTPHLTALASGQECRQGSGQESRPDLRPIGQDSGGPRDGAGKSPEPTTVRLTDTELAFDAVQAAGRRSAVFSRNDVAGRVAAELPTDGLTGPRVLARIEQLTDLALTLSETVPVGQPPRGVTPRASDALYATVEVLQAEARILTLAQEGRRGGHGQVGSPQVRAAAAALATNASADAPPGAGAGQGQQVGLDPGQAAALVRLTTGGDLLAVLTAPAGAGKTSTLGAASHAWTAAGYRVVGLAPSARAAAELHEATAGRTDTLAKWLHNHDRLQQGQQLPPAERAWTDLDGRTVVIVDEASMASTLDLDQLTAAAAAAGSKVVLVGDPGQIGVINGPGGMLAALTHAGHGIELEQIHRFSQAWERSASLQLRAGNPGVLDVYEAKDRLHPCPDSDTALKAVFEHWTAARAEGQDALMLARTRLDVDALNTFARQAAQAAGTVTGPAVTAGDREWQAGDLLRTRRNQRTLTLTATSTGSRGSAGDDRAGHVRNGDRYRVLSPATSTGPDGKPAPTGGLVVEDLTGRGRVILPADYLAEHCEYGWASTIDAAQGATADLGLVLVRPGLDREHLYVAMTRGRHANHAYITTDQPEDPDHDHQHGPTRAPAASAPGTSALGAGAPEAAREAHHQAHQVLTAALSQSGAKDAAHTALAKARDAARQAAGVTRPLPQEHQQQEVDLAKVPGTAPEQRTSRPHPDEHSQVLEALGAFAALERLQQQRATLLAHQAQLRTTIKVAESTLGATSRWARGHRRDLTTTLTSSREQLASTQPELDRLEQEIDHAGRLVDAHARQRYTTDTDTAAGTGSDAPDTTSTTGGDPTSLAAARARHSIRQPTPGAPVRSRSQAPFTGAPGQLRPDGLPRLTGRPLDGTAAASTTRPNGPEPTPGPAPHRQPSHRDPGRGR